MARNRAGGGKPHPEIFPGARKLLMIELVNVSKTPSETQCTPTGTLKQCKAGRVNKSTQIQETRKYYFQEIQFRVIAAMRRCPLSRPSLSRGLRMARTTQHHMTRSVTLRRPGITRKDTGAVRGIILLTPCHNISPLTLGVEVWGTPTGEGKARKGVKFPPNFKK